MSSLPHFLIAAPVSCLSTPAYPHPLPCLTSLVPIQPYHHPLTCACRLSWAEQEHIPSSTAQAQLARVAAWGGDWGAAVEAATQVRGASAMGLLANTIIRQRIKIVHDNIKCSQAQREMQLWRQPTVFLPEPLSYKTIPILKRSFGIRMKNNSLFHTGVWL